MSRTSNPKPEDTNAAKKAIVLGTEKKNRMPLLLTLSAIVLVAGSLAAYSILNPTSRTGGAQSATPSSQAPNAVVAYAVSDFADGQARHYQHAVGNHTIRYFILKSSDGIIRAAFDACDVCWPAGKGYYQDDDVMVCRNCGRRFASIHVNEVSGGCNPAPLPRKIEGDKVVIRVEDIIAGKNYFNFT